MKKILLTPNPYRDKDFKTVRNAMQVLQAAGADVKICLPFDVDRSFDLPKDLHFVRMEREIQNADAVICLGGDGTILHMAKTATRYGVPILGINIGTMGFMAELESTELSQLTRLVEGNFTLDRRMMLDVTVRRDRDIIFHELCLNDAVITKGAVARIVHLSVKCDGVEAIECGGDGVVIATPTGSTAYNLSAGGPIVEPDAKNILITPICAHDMCSRCIVASMHRKITVELTRNARRNAFLSVDGGKALKLNMGDVTYICSSDKEIKLIRLKNRSFYDIINTKFRNFERG